MSDTSLATPDNPIYRRRVWVNRFNLVMSVGTMLFGMTFLLWILFALFSKGLAAFGPAMFTQMTPPPGSDGGLANAIFGSLMIVGAAIFVATPIGILAGIYLAEVDRTSWVAKTTRFVNDILLSAPSIVIGLFVYTLIVANVKHYSGWAGAVALAIIAVPVVVRTTETMLLLVPNSMREAAVALGAPQWRVVTMVTLKAVKGGIVTGVLLALARISGETAPLLFTSLNNQFWSTDMNAPMANLPVVIFQFAMSPYEEWQRLAWAGAVALAIIAVPVVVRTTETMLLLVPNSMREAAVALGAPQWRVVTMVTLKAVKGGIVTGVLLALARISGETAPLLFTSLNNQFWSTDMNAPMANLPVVIFQFAMSPYEEWQRLAWAGALLITLAVLLLNIVARTLFRQKHQ